MTHAVVIGAGIVGLIATAAALMWRADTHHELGRVEEADRNPWAALRYTRRANVALAVACLVLLAAVAALVVVVAWETAG